MFLGAAWTSALSIGGKSGGAVAGLMNAASNLGGFASPVLLGWALQVWRDWDSVLMVAVMTNAVAAFLWLGVNPREPSDGSRTPQRTRTIV
jgi:ACS family glucarate transporter-like MFS transporter